MPSLLKLLSLTLMLMYLPPTFATQMKSGPSQEEIQKKMATWEVLKQAEQWRKDLVALGERYHQGKAAALSKCDKILSDLETKVNTLSLPDQTIAIMSFQRGTKKQLKKVENNIKNGSAELILSKYDFLRKINETREDIKKEANVSDELLASIKKQFTTKEGQAMTVNNPSSSNGASKKQISKKDYIAIRSVELSAYPANIEKRCEALPKQLDEIQALYKQYLAQEELDKN